MPSNYAINNPWNDKFYKPFTSPLNTLCTGIQNEAN